jgi:hypothetical protein
MLAISARLAQRLQGAIWRIYVNAQCVKRRRHEPTCADKVIKSSCADLVLGLSFGTPDIGC